MALIVEDGTGTILTVDSYATLVEFYAYTDNRGIDYSAIAESVIEQNMRKSFDYLIQRYRHRWNGYRKTATQIGDWPRSFVYLEPFIQGAVGAYPYLVSDSIVPTEVKNAQIELAMKANAEDLMADQDQQILKVVIGPIEVNNDKNSPQIKRYTAVDAMLSPYLANSNSLTRRAQRA